jgi:hypothetical protein
MFVLTSFLREVIFQKSNISSGNAVASFVKQLSFENCAAAPHRFEK